MQYVTPLALASLLATTLAGCVFFDSSDDTTQAATAGVQDGASANAAFLELNTRLWHADCLCGWEAAGHASVAACEAVSVAPSLQACLEGVFTRHLDAATQWVGCYDEATRYVEGCPQTCGASRDSCLEQGAGMLLACDDAASYALVSELDSCLGRTSGAATGTWTDALEDARYNMNVGYVGLLIEACTCAGRGDTDEALEACVRDAYSPFYGDGCWEQALALDEQRSIEAMICYEDHLWAMADCLSMCPADEGACDDPMQACNVFTSAQHEAMAACE